MNDILRDSTKTQNEVPRSGKIVTDDEFDSLLVEMRAREKANAQEAEKDQISTILEDIENEFKELDDIMREADELTINYNYAFGDEASEDTYLNYAPGV